METNPKAGISAALQIAYKAVTNIRFKHHNNESYTHQQLVSDYPGQINFNTLHRIRDGKVGKPVTDRFFLRLFVSILDKEYQYRISNGGDAANEILCIKSKILDLMLEISSD